VGSSISLKLIHLIQNNNFEVLVFRAVLAQSILLLTRNLEKAEQYSSLTEFGSLESEMLYLYI